MLKQPLRYFVVVYFILLCVLIIPRIAAAQSPTPTQGISSAVSTPTLASTQTPIPSAFSATPPITQPTSNPDWFSNFVPSFLAAAGGAIGGAFIVYLLEERKRKTIRREEIETAIRRLYDEAVSNQQWLSDLTNTRLYLRDEAWVLLKNQGYLFFLPKNVSMTVADVYKYLHALNENTRALREALARKEKIASYERNVLEGIERLRPVLDDLITQLENLSIFQRITKQTADWQR